MGVNYAVRERKSSPLCNDFAREFITRQYGELAAAKIYANPPLYKRGPTKGQPKGWVMWTKCTKGGWVRTGSYDQDSMRGQGFVMAPGTHDVQIVLTNPSFMPDGKVYGLEAGQRRGVETDIEWADRCELAIKQMQGIAIPAPRRLDDLCHPNADKPVEILGAAISHLLKSNASEWPKLSPGHPLVVAVELLIEKCRELGGTL